MAPHAHSSRRSAVRRGPLRAWAETRGLVGGHTAARRRVTLRSADGTHLHAVLLPGPGTPGRGPAVVLAHGFAAHGSKPAYAWLADELATRVTVLVPDLRGHGRSGGASHLGGAEGADVAAGVDLLRGLGHGWVAAVGASMGGTSVATAVADGVRVDAAVLVSAPAWIEDAPTTVPMQRLHRLWTSTSGRLAVRAGVGVRVASPARWQRPRDPADALAGWDGPLLVVHGDDDAYFPLAHAQRLAGRAGGTTTLWVERGFGHAEDGFRGTFGVRLADALLHAARHDRMPDRQELPWPA